MYQLIWNNEVIESDIESMDEAQNLQAEYGLAYGGTVTIEQTDEEEEINISTVYDSFYNGQFKQFVSQVDEFGVDDFVNQLQQDHGNSVPRIVAFKMLKTYILLSE